ncbi:MAG: hypothetical protein LBF40_07955 [Deltaproteobacteria bacterium]|jgi:hypothetical protein|nr:hypothetical protein [Deltaproteobacteria bacterium]
MKESNKTSGIKKVNVEEALVDLTDRIGSLETRMAMMEELLKRPQAKLRVPRNYQDYQKVRALLDRGSSINGASKILQMPYTTCHFYAKATQETVEKLRITPHFNGTDIDREGK